MNSIKIFKSVVISDCCCTQNLLQINFSNRLSDSGSSSGSCSTHSFKDPAQKEYFHQPDVLGPVCPYKIALIGNLDMLKLLNRFQTFILNPETGKI